ncbi:MBL fold metallo-hydrolase [Pseudomonas nicosulfuronedens]|uniref:MBL fold metallo-hydrolase n=1 Tax=Pseudomonas nicosulfuronedens TaxID=2571105 RepID=A0A5R9R7C9_9PSED|nr:MBL fold metallo-hydrolase [Pseudomonas nicosulfuronedens]MDH1010155.1 MBL fold metallo-hydrolase [Pseudomonas nicosulfuronedens]MDH1980171.1 MBL fold metallo-hydrolase [Pseudomonas nicosulfuronedens]MDH2025390.1 MBL fold metallo-hydrolase [Pseudomonas nicosulfuronedens]TLX78798.1 MBL fold metallo-hydrolase [Pseudomonas nicosulfuronedens]
MTARIQHFFDTATFTYSYVVADPVSRRCAIVDPVLDYDAAAGRIGHESARRIVDYVREQGLTVEWLLETHLHADHLSASAWLKTELGGRLAIGSSIAQVQRTFAGILNLGEGFPCDGSQFDHLFSDGEHFSIGELQVEALHTPGHTPACMTYLVGDAAFVGDTLFMPDYGTARCDFPGGDARQLYRSIQRLFALPETTRLFLCHDYLTADREEHQHETSVAQERKANVHVHEGVAEDAFVLMRNKRDATLQAPALIWPSIQVNMRGGVLPAVEENGVRYLRIPLDQM